jgi:cytolysin-activating lysine-acyltransferase
MARRGCDKPNSVMTPVILQQFRMFYQDAPPEQGGRRPIGVILWGTVSADVDAMLARGTNRLRPQDWKSGDTAWVVEVIAPFGGGDAMVADLKAKVFAGRELRALVIKDGRREVRVM